MINHYKPLWTIFVHIFWLVEVSSCQGNLGLLYLVWSSPGTLLNEVPKMGVTQHGWLIMENPTKWMIWGYPDFIKLGTMCVCIYIYTYIHVCIYIHILLVVEKPSEKKKNITGSWDYYSQYMENMFQTTNHMYIYIYILIWIRYSRMLCYFLTWQK